MAKIGSKVRYHCLACDKSLGAATTAIVVDTVVCRAYACSEACEPQVAKELEARGFGKVVAQ